MVIKNKMDIKKDYSFVECLYKNSVCEHCNRKLINVYVITDGTKNYNVGCECVKGLIGKGFDKNIEIKSVKELAFLKFLNKEVKLINYYAGTLINGGVCWYIKLFNKSLEDISPNTSNAKQYKLCIHKTNDNITIDLRNSKYYELIKDTRIIEDDEFRDLKYGKKFMREINGI